MRLHGFQMSVAMGRSPLREPQAVGLQAF